MLHHYDLLRDQHTSFHDIYNPPTPLFLLLLSLSHYFTGKLLTGHRKFPHVIHIASLTLIFPTVASLFRPLLAANMPPKKLAAAQSKTDTIKEQLQLEGFSKAFIAEHIRALIRIYAIRGIKDPYATDLSYDIMFMDPTTSPHFHRFRDMWRFRLSKSSPFVEWWSAFRAFLRDCFDKTRVQMNRFANENPDAPVQRPTHGTQDCEDNVGNGRDNEWYPGLAKMRPARHESNSAPVLIVNPNTAAAARDNIVTPATPMKRRWDDISPSPSPIKGQGRGGALRKAAVGKKGKAPLRAVPWVSIVAPPTLAGPSSSSVPAQPLFVPPRIPGFQTPEASPESTPVPVPGLSSFTAINH